MIKIAFIILSLISIFSALMVISRKNPVASVLWLVFHFFGIAGLYVLLGAHFLAAVQIIVYAGAIMVLFLFVVMMLNLNLVNNEKRGKIIGKSIGAVVSGLVLVLFTYSIRTTKWNELFFNQVTDQEWGTAVKLGSLLFSNWLVPFQIVGILLFAAVIGVVALMKRKITRKVENGIVITQEEDVA
ncbi:MAG: NADH-quinone oxidoreductase subunit J [bacterium]|nr:NADH-quinone oxidoreductase subunit J [bacterium]